MNFIGRAGETQTVEFFPVADTRIEGYEFVLTSMANVSNGAVDISATSRVNIIGDDVPVLSMTRTSGNEDDGVIVLTFTLDHDVAGGFSVEINTTDNSAQLSNSDYIALSSEVLNFTGKAGETQTLEFFPVADTDIEGDEHVTILMANVSNTTVDISDRTRVKITGDDGLEFSLSIYDD